MVGPLQQPTKASDEHGINSVKHSLSSGRVRPASRDTKQENVVNDVKMVLMHQTALCALSWFSQDVVFLRWIQFPLY